MANFNQVTLIGRLTRDPDYRQFANGAMVTLGFAVSDKKKNQATGQYEDHPMFIDVKVWNRGDKFKLADFIADRCKKGHQLMVNGKLELDQWEDKNGGGKRSKHIIVADEVQLFEPRQDGQGQGGQNAPQGQQNRGNYGGNGQGQGNGQRNNYQQQNNGGRGNGQYGGNNQQYSDQQGGQAGGDIPF